MSLPVLELTVRLAAADIYANQSAWRRLCDECGSLFDMLEVTVDI